MDSACSADCKVQQHIQYKAWAAHLGQCLTADMHLQLEYSAYTLTTWLAVVLAQCTHAFYMQVELLRQLYDLHQSLHTVMQDITKQTKPYLVYFLQYPAL